MRLLPGTPVLERYRSSRLVQYRDFTVEAELDGRAAGDDGVLVSHGDPQAGYVLYIEGGRLRFGYNAYGRVDVLDGGTVPGDVRSVRLHAAAASGLRWDFTLSIAAGDGPPCTVAVLPGRFQLVGMAPWTGISVGRDARGPVLWELRERHGTFPFTGALRAVTYTPGPLAVPAEAVEEIRREAEALAD
ncbi:hypothetical protein ACFQXA_08135 [Nocardiopsis composta]